MSKCPNCGAEVEIGMKFCGECGTPIPQVKKCINCGTELPIKMKFCFECGAPQEGARSGVGFSMGDKNVIAGDVIGQKIAGDNVQSKIMGNAIYNTFQDDTKRVNSCHVCGKHLTNVNGHTCPGCGKVVCEEHFDAKANLCLRCAVAKKEQNVSKYKEALQEVLADGVVDFNERAMLKKLQVQLGISDKDAEFWEQAAKSSIMQSAYRFTAIENINLKKAEDLFYEKGEIEKAYQLVEPIYKSHPINETLLNIYLPIVVQHDIKIAKQTIQSIKVDCLALCIAEIEIALLENRLDIVERKLQQGKKLWADNGMLKCYEALFYIRLAFESGKLSYIQEAKKVTESFAETDDKIELTLQTKMQKALAALDCEQVNKAADNQRNLYKALYLRDIGISKVSVGPQRRIKSIQQAIDLTDAGGTISIDAGLYKEHLFFTKNLKLVGTQGSILNKSSKSLPIIVLDADKTCKLSKAVEIEGVVFTHKADLSFDNLNEYVRREKGFKGEHDYFNYGEDGWNTLLLVESDAVLNNVAILDSDNYGITFSKNSAKMLNSVVSRCYDNCIYCIENTSAEISTSIISHSSYSGVVVGKNSRLTIIDCEIFGHLSDGIWEKGNACGTYVSCDIHDNYGDGVGIQDSASGSYKNCHVHDNAQNGFVIAGEATPKIESCKIHDNKTDGKKYPGVVVKENSKPTITGCEIFGHLSHGICEKGNARGIYSDCDIHSNSGIGIGITDSASGTFRNCSVHDMMQNGGFDIKGESTPKIENCKITSIWAQENSKPTITGCEILCGIQEMDKASGTYSDCDIHSWELYGVDIQDSASGTFKNCHVHDNKEAGFNISGAADPKIERCKIHDNMTGVGPIYCRYGYGIRAGENACGTYSDCDIYNNDVGIYIKDSASGTFKNCNVHGNKGFGFDITGKTSPKIANCIIHDNKIAPASGGIAASGVVVGKNSRPTITGCEIYGHERYGIWEIDKNYGFYMGCNIHDNGFGDISYHTRKK